MNMYDTCPSFLGLPIFSSKIKLWKQTRSAWVDQPGKNIFQTLQQRKFLCKFYELFKSETPQPCLDDSTNCYSLRGWTLNLSRVDYGPLRKLKSENWSIKIRPLLWIKDFNGCYVYWHIIFYSHIPYLI